MTAERRLATLAALFAPASATSLLARCAGDAAADAVAHATRLAAAPRAERLGALAAALSTDAAAVRGAAELAARAERPRVAAVLRGIAGGAPAEAGVSPVLLRLCFERTAR